MHSIHHQQNKNNTLQAKAAGGQGRGIIDNRAQAVAQRQQAHALVKPAAGEPVLQRMATQNGVVQLWRAVAGQQGQFEGDPAYHHLHRPGGGNEHYRYANGHHFQYIHGGRVNRGGLVAAIAACRTAQPVNTGQDECLAYLEALLAETPEEKKAAPPAKKDPPPPPKPPKGGGGGGKKGKKLNQLGDAMIARNAEEIF